VSESRALSGVVANRHQCPAIHYTPDEYKETLSGDANFLKAVSQKK
jgi:hypothetical protein